MEIYVEINAPTPRSPMNMAFMSGSVLYRALFVNNVFVQDIIPFMQTQGSKHRNICDITLAPNKNAITQQKKRKCDVGILTRTSLPCPSCLWLTMKPLQIHLFPVFHGWNWLTVLYIWSKTIYIIRLRLPRYSMNADSFSCF